ncbi:hypothetical protein [Pantoea septica]|uniref:hypothetical protein n=2 Tax=Pantoea septica TaxID=472695 RepID=UPI0012EBDE5E|nr:hypothetical protein [Pantoea septica]
MFLFGSDMLCAAMKAATHGKQESRQNETGREISPKEGGNASDSARRHLLIHLNVGGDWQHASTLLVHNAVDHRFLLCGGGKPAKLWGKFAKYQESLCLHNGTALPASRRWMNWSVCTTTR